MERVEESKYTTIRVDREAMAKLKEMAPGGNVGGYLRSLTEAEHPKPLEDKLNVLRSDINRRLDRISRDIEALAVGGLQFQNLRDFVSVILENNPKLLENVRKNPAAQGKMVSLFLDSEALRKKRKEIFAQEKEAGNDGGIEQRYR